MSLGGRAIAISIGGAPDLAKLGFPSREVERALLSVCGALVRAGARIAYGGDFRPGGFTVRMYRYLAGAYADHDARPFQHYLAEPTLRRMRFDDLVTSLRESQSVSEAVAFLDGQRLPMRASAGTLLVGENTSRRVISSPAEFANWLDSRHSVPLAEAYSHMRVAQSQDTDGRVAMGGKMGLIGHVDDTYEGAMPGIAEEALLTLDASKPFVPLAAYGGATRDVAIALGILDANERTPRALQAVSYGEAMAAVAGMASRIPASCVLDLQTLARTERIESVADLTVSTLNKWLVEQMA